MKQFSIKILVFLLPFICAIVFAGFSYQKSGGDLNKIGKISYDKNYRLTFRDAFNQEKKFTDFSRAISDTITKFDILTIGDSFSGQQQYGYQNYLALNHDLNVLNFNFNSFYKVRNYNPVHFLSELINGDILSNYNIDYIIIEVIERRFIDFVLEVNFDSSISLEEIKLIKRVYPKTEETFLKKTNNFLIDTKKYYKYKLGYLFSPKPFDSDVYKMNLVENMFRVNLDEITFYYQDISSLNRITKRNIFLLNQVLNNFKRKLEKDNIKLIVMPCVDKYDLYAPYIKDNPFPENSFFNFLRKEEKDYLFIDTKKVLEPYVNNGVKDVFFADDTHWSPIASEIIANEIFRVIKNDKK
ncbi:alginate O-acetyltransferase AlgX-related protein [Formosa maritima]|uniref:AlgX/AlgJ SGNH hydrolase-like domain-containing protein n=1 Tax=Formosa maritima TaxID=2592046 RepID=A0A5D0GCL8_9FLAO|nr:hypothetical protein [Formosa maritima]TYA56646.1 hypothetical protein FVF61_05780 [Formosa maritima]